MVRSQALPFENYTCATPGQITWVYLNTIIDYDERVARVHVHCLPKFNQQYCEVCHQPITDISMLPPELRDKVYRPSEGESYHIDVDLSRKEIFGEEGEEVEQLVAD